MDSGIEDILSILEVVDWVDQIDTGGKDWHGLHRRRQSTEKDFLETLTDIEFLNRFRMSKTCFCYVLEQIEDKLIYSSKRNCPVLAANQLLIALRFYAAGNYHVTNGDFFQVSPSTASRIIKKVSHALADLAPKHIQLPGAQEAEKVKSEFFALAGFPGVIGAIDCTHVKIQSVVGGSEAETFRNPTGYFSLNVQMISDARLKIRDIVARWPGSTHDSLIFHGSRARATFQTKLNQDGVLIGDSAYTLKAYLLTPYQQPETPAQENYNKRHAQTWSTVERQHGLLKGRFPALTTGLRLNLNTTMAVIMACAVLHNICIDLGEEQPEEWMDYTSDVPNVILCANAEDGADLRRDDIANNMFT